MNEEQKQFRNIVLQEQSAAEFMRAQERRIPELALKHKVTVTQPIHCEYLVEGDAKNVANFLEELTRIPAPSPIDVTAIEEALQQKEWK